MDRICISLIDKINSIAQTGRYAVVSAEELYDALPDGETDADGIKQSLKTLADGGYIDVKYSDGDLYCLAPLKKYDPPEEISVPEEPISQPEAKKKRDFSCFLPAFLGGALGSLLISLAFAFI